MIVQILFYALVTIAWISMVGAFLFFAWYCSTNGGDGYPPKR